MFSIEVKFWQTVIYLEENHRETILLEMAHRLEIPSELLLRFLSFLEKYLETKIVVVDDKPYDSWRVIPVESTPDGEHNPFLKLDHSPDQIFHFLNELDLEFGEQHAPSVEDLIEEVIDDREVQSYLEHLSLAAELEKAISNHQLIEMYPINDRKRKDLIIPLKLVFISGEVNLVAQKVKEYMLSCIDLRHIHKISLLPGTSPTSFFDVIQVNQFVAGIQTLDEGRIRLVLRVKRENREFLDHLKQVSHLEWEKPYWVQNTAGDLIFAVSTSMGEELIAWLKDHQQEATIIDPPFLNQLMNHAIIQGPIKSSKIA